MSPKKRKLFAEKFADLGNLAAAGMIFGNSLSEANTDPSTIYLGIIFVLLCYIVSGLL
jgi:hypothetical protein